MQSSFVEVGRCLICVGLQDGMRQEQHLGSYLRERYVINETFLSANYSAKEVRS